MSEENSVPGCGARFHGHFIDKIHPKLCDRWAVGQRTVDIIPSESEAKEEYHAKAIS
jgi:hypothetical protein